MRRCFQPVIGGRVVSAARGAPTSEIKFRNPISTATDPARTVELRGGQHKDRSDKGKPAERRRRKATGLQSPPGIRQPGRRRHLSGSEIVAFVPHGQSASLVRPHLDGEIAVAGITFDARGLELTGALMARPDCPAAAATPGSRPFIRALIDAVGRSHTTPTPDPDPRDLGRRTSGALRLSELTPCLTHTASPGRAQGLHYPAPRTHQSSGARSPLANTPRLGPAHLYSIGLRGRVLN
jgi:hypothetical protein